MFDAKDPEVQCKGCMTCRRITPIGQGAIDNVPLTLKCFLVVTVIYQ